MRCTLLPRLEQTDDRDCEHAFKSPGRRERGRCTSFDGTGGNGVLCHAGRRTRDGLGRTRPFGIAPVAGPAASGGVRPRRRRRGRRSIRRAHRRCTDHRRLRPSRAFFREHGPCRWRTRRRGPVRLNEDRRFDFVLDLNGTPLLMHEVPPIGYFAPRDESALTGAIERIRTQPTSLRRPRYFAYEAARCTHGAAGITGCTRCLDACPAGAVTSAGEKVRFDPFLCQGCGTCTAVCPDGAVRYAHPAAAAMRRPSSVLPSRAACSAACASRGAPNMRFNGSRASLFPALSARR